ncbi:N-acetylmuramoyl-L-alanine amidase [Legionella lytica]|uniref:N-acetylmuramoyl-L-alanine amidase n=1 Tax=Legionella lytica TaxID=96232 RepID=A0ABY4YB77_9GAMM|nr:N-acetylmuramoyl-L-alanine amidase [Legionella lytica]USQ14309.1 N-acetylmuramoyl-L-alanine amidase [Legionella lytica]
MILRSWSLLLVLFFSSVGAFGGQLKAIALKQQKNQTSLFFSLDGPFMHKLFVLSQPDRVVIDLKDTQLATNLNHPSLTNALIQHMRTGNADFRTLRLVLDITQKVQVRSVPWQPPGGTYGVRVDLMYTKEPVTVAAVATPVLASPAPVAVKASVKLPVKPILARQAPVKVSTGSTKALRDVIIVLDAGHGGKDAGARGPHASKEKDVVLAITLKLKRLIDQQPGMRAVLTRSGDYYVGLRERLDIARKYNGDIFVAIHADAFHNPHSNGASVFALSQRGATSEAAHWLAEKENYSELGGVNLGELDDRNGVVRSVLIDLSQTATINAGLEMGKRVLNQLGGFATLHNSRVEQARFVVLKSPDIPSILVETGFISNPREERNLTSPAYQLRLSQAIFQGIKGYFWENPPHGSRIEAMITNKFHLVRAGETLPAIAARYRVTVNALQAANHLRGITQLKPGQKLMIPATWA